MIMNYDMKYKKKTLFRKHGLLIHSYNAKKNYFRFNYEYLIKSEALEEEV